MDLNAQANRYDEQGRLQPQKDHEAARAFFLEDVNTRTRFFHDLEEKIDYLVTNEFWDGDTLSLYSGDFIKDAFKRAYSHKFRFQSFLGALKFYSAYALRSDDGETILERFEDRVTMVALYLAQGDEQFALNLIDEIITGRFQPATPTFQNAGKARRGELVSCFLLRASDSLDSIQDTWRYSAQLSKAGGGVAISMTDIREQGARLKGKKGLAKGVVPWMKIYEDIFSTVDQLGTRQGAGAVYLSIHHPDIEQFLDTKRENADEKIRIKTLSTGVVIPDIFFTLAKNNEDAYLFSPYDVKREYGTDLSELDITANYRDMVSNSNIGKRKVNARNLLMQIAELQAQSGYPYLVFSDTANRANPIDGRITMSNLCVTGDTRILTAEGYRTVRDLHETQEDFDVMVDTRARDMDLGARGLSRETSTKMFKTAENADIYKMTTKEGHVLRATAWHKMYVKRDDNIQKIALHELVPGDKILVQSDEGSWGSEHDPDLAYLAGAVAADGTIAESMTSAGNVTSTVRIPLYGDKDEFAPALRDAAHAVLANQTELATQRQATLTPEFVVQDDYNRMSLHSAPLATVLKGKGVTQCNKLSVPEFVLSGTRETQQAFLNGVFQLDGTITGNLKAGTLGIELGSVSEQFLQEIQRILLNFNIYSRIYVSRKGGRALLPDGRGSHKLYSQQQMYSLRVTNRSDREKLFPLITWKQSQLTRWEALSNAGTRRGKPYDTHKHLATVADIEFDGIEDVYDVTVENGNSVIFNGIATGNCSEIMQVNTPTEYDDQGDVTETGQDISCNLGSMNIYNVMRDGNLAQTVETGIRALTAVSDLTSINRVPTVRLANERLHSIGLGQMSLATFFGTHQMHYGDPESLDFTNIYFMTVRYHALRASRRLAVERGEKFYGFERSQYADGSALSAYTDGEEIAPATEKVKGLFQDAGITLPSQEDWKALREDIMRDGLYNAYMLAVPPTGSISYLNYASASIHPITSLIEIRKEGRTGRVYFPTPHLTEENKEYFRDAYEVGPDALIDVYAEATKHTDQGLSCTLFFKDTATTRAINKAQIRAFSKGLKSLYYIRLRSVQLSGTDIEECVSCAL